MEKKYELADEIKLNTNGEILHRIRALKSFYDVRKGELGGFIRSEENLSQTGSCWVHNDAKVCGNGRVSGDAQIYDNVTVFDNADVSGHALLFEYVRVDKNASVYGHSKLYDRVYITDDARVFGTANIHDHVQIHGNAQILGSVNMCNNTHIADDGYIYSDNDYAIVSGFGSINRTTTFYIANDDSIRVVCGCFRGTLDEFRKKVKKSYPMHYYKEEYLMIADLMEKRFKNRVKNHF